MLTIDRTHDQAAYLGGGQQLSALLLHSDHRAGQPLSDFSQRTLGLGQLYRLDLASGEIGQLTD